MKYEIDYSKLPAEAKRAKALADIREYVGDEVFYKIDALLREAIAREEIRDFETFTFNLFLFPVSGYPLEAWWEEITGQPVQELPDA